MRAITSFSAHHDIAVIEDAAHALPARYYGANVGTFGRLAAFSFYATKTVTTGEGGMVVCGNEELAHRISVMRLHGMSKDAWKRYQQNGSWLYDVVAPGFKYNLSDLHAAIGIVQLEKAESLRRARERIAERYTRCLQELDVISVPCVSSDVLHAWHLYVIVLRPNALRLDRDAFIEELTKRGIGCSVHFTPLHMLTYYRDTYGYQRGQFPVAEAYYEGCISLPIYPEMTDDDVDRVIEAVTDVIGRSSRQPRSLRAKIRMPVSASTPNRH
jgi:perosamine synthetase